MIPRISLADHSGKGQSSKNELKREKMSKRIKWTYKAELDYILELEKGKWVIGFLNEKGNPYECPTTIDQKLVEKLKLEESRQANRLKVTVEINEKMDEKNRQYPILIDVSICHTMAQANK